MRINSDYRTITTQETIFDLTNLTRKEMEQLRHGLTLIIVPLLDDQEAITTFARRLQDALGWGTDTNPVIGGCRRQGERRVVSIRTDCKLRRSNRERRQK